MKKSRKRFLVLAALLLAASVFVFLVLYPTVIPRRPYVAPETSFHNWDEIMASPQPITIQTYSTGMMYTELSGIINLEHEKAAAIEDRMVEIPVTASIIQHQKWGAYLIDAGLDASYVNNPYGTTRGILAKRIVSSGSQEPNTHIAAILERENIQLQGVWLTHLHPDHTAGIVDLPKDIQYVAGEGERYINFRFFMQTDHLEGIEALYEIDFSKGIDLPPFGKCVDLFGDGSFWAIEASGHSQGDVMYFINGVEEKVIVAGDACNDQNQFDTGVGPGSYSSDVEKAQQILDSIILFTELHPEVKLVYGHDL